MNRNAYTPITADPVLLRLNSCRDWGTLHQRIRKAFGFPDYYGENWDAMWDCLTDVFLQPVQRHIVVEGFDAMPLRCRRFSATFRRNVLGSRSHTADRRDSKKLWAARERKDAPQGLSFLLLCPDSVRRPSTAHVFHRILYFFIL